MSDPAPITIPIAKIRAARAESCGTCKYAEPDGAGMTCRFNPPVPFLVPGPQGQPATMGVFPPVNPKSWCREFKLNLLNGAK
jgi:hypothetical protein